MIHCFQDVLICLIVDLFIVDLSVCQMISVPQIIDPKWDSFSAACYRKPEDNREHCFSTEGANNTLGGDHCSRYSDTWSCFLDISKITTIFVSQGIYDERAVLSARLSAGLGEGEFRCKDQLCPHVVPYNFTSFDNLQPRQVVPAGVY